MRIERRKYSAHADFYINKTRILGVTLWRPSKGIPWWHIIVNYPHTQFSYVIRIEE